MGATLEQRRGPVGHGTVPNGGIAPARHGVLPESKLLVTPCATSRLLTTSRHPTGVANVGACSDVAILPSRQRPSVPMPRKKCSSNIDAPLLQRPRKTKCKKKLATSTFFRKGGSEKVRSGIDWPPTTLSDPVDPRHSAKARPRHVRASVKVNSIQCLAKSVVIGGLPKKDLLCTTGTCMVCKSRPKKVPANSSRVSSPTSSPSSTGNP